MDNHTVCEKFVKQSNTHGLGSNLRYEGNVLYSYNTEIARIVDGELYYSVDRMSASTGRHLTHLWHAAYHSKLPIHLVYYRFNDRFGSNTAMLRTTYTNLIDVVVKALASNSSYAASRPLTQCQKRRELLHYVGMVEDLNKTLERYFPTRIDATFLVRLVRKVLKETKANRRRWRTWNTFVPSDYNDVLRELTDPRSSSWRTLKEIEEQRLYDGYLEELHDLGIYELSKELYTLRAVGGSIYDDPEYHARLAAIDTRFRVRLAEAGSAQLPPFYVNNPRWVHFMGRDSVPASLFRQMAYQLTVDSNAGMTTNHLEVSAHVDGSRHRLIFDRRYASNYQLDSTPLSPDVYGVILKLIKEVEENANQSEYAAD